MEREFLKYNRELAKRFVSDYNLPIPIINEAIFNYHLCIYEREYGTITKWCGLIDMINERYEGSTTKFLDDYYNIRENIIQTVLNSDAYKKFNEMDMSQFAVKDKLNITSNNIYNEGNIGSLFLSIDLKKANFQALKSVDPQIVLGADTYEDFIGQFTDLDYVKESKYTRQVIFGMMNPKRHITVEKYIIRKIYQFVVDLCPVLDGKCISLSNDEMIFKIDGNIADDKSVKRLRGLNKISGFDVHIELFRLHGYDLKYLNTSKTKTTFYVKEYYDDEEHNLKLICAPLPYHAIIYKLYRGLDLCSFDYHFDYEGADAMLCENFFMAVHNKQ